jgi:PAS domain S-box-containing protein
MVIVDRSGTIRMANRQTQRLFGYTRTELIGRTVEMLMPEGFRRTHVVERKGYTAAPSSRPMGIVGMTLSGRRKDGSDFPVEIGLSPLHTGTETLVCSVIRDITRRKKAEEEIRALNTELEARVAARTAALQSSNEALRQAIEDRRRLEGEIIGISESERQRIAQDLHDDLGQQIAGVWFMSLSLQKNLEMSSSPEAGSAARIAGILGKALDLTRSLARGLHPVTSEPGGLVTALNELAARSSELFKIRCRVVCRSSVISMHPTTATHLYRIAQEAVTNAVKHGAAKHVDIMLSSSPGKIVLTVNDDGNGAKQPFSGNTGMGVRIMKYRAETLGGTLAFRTGRRGGTSVICTVPNAAEIAPKET